MLFPFFELLWFVSCYLFHDAIFFFQDMFPDHSFDDLLKIVIMNDHLACDPEDGGCGKPNHIHHILSSPPHVFTVGKLLYLQYVWISACNQSFQSRRKEP